MHYQRWKHHGDPTKLLEVHAIGHTPIQRWAQRVELPVDPEGCWQWKGVIYRNGYAQVTIGRVKILGHRFAYEHFVGPIPEGLVIDHLCRNRACVNPAHLEAVTQQQNLARGVGLSAINGSKTHCHKGHPFTPENTARRGKGRMCRTCNRKWQRGERRGI